MLLGCSLNMLLFVLPQKVTKNRHFSLSLPRAKGAQRRVMLKLGTLLSAIAAARINLALWHLQAFLHF